jgi:hypothetical protein
MHCKPTHMTELPDAATGGVVVRDRGRAYRRVGGWRRFEKVAAAPRGSASSTQETTP